MSSPRLRRLMADHEAVRQLVLQSSILDMSCSGDPVSTYLFRFAGRGLCLDAQGNLQEQWVHEVRVHLGANYPRVMPELHWLTPIFHPNISANGLVCLGGYSTHWVPSLRLDDLCLMLWDMIRYRNFDIGSPYNRVAAEWARTQRHYILPLDPRPLRDLSVRAEQQGGGSPEHQATATPRISPSQAVGDRLVGQPQFERDWTPSVSNGRVCSTEPMAEITFL